MMCIFQKGSTVNNFYSFTDAPIITIFPSQSPYTVGVGANLFLNCKADGVPAPTVQWFSGKQAVVYNAQLYQQSYLVPTNTPGTNAYTCEGSNNAGDVTQRTRQDITVIVKGIVGMILL